MKCLREIFAGTGGCVGSEVMGRVVVRDRVRGLVGPAEDVVETPAFHQARPTISKGMRPLVSEQLIGNCFYKGKIKAACGPGLDGVQPVMVLSTSSAADDINRMYQNRCNSYVVKPNNYKEFQTLIKLIIDHWNAVKFPRAL